jgi:hypothetical protein
VAKVKQDMKKMQDEMEAADNKKEEKSEPKHSNGKLAKPKC